MALSTLPTSGATLALTDAGNTVMTPGTKLTLISYSGAWNNAIFDTFADDSTFTLGVNTFTIDYNDPNGILSTNLNAGSFGNYVTLTSPLCPKRMPSGWAGPSASCSAFRSAPANSSAFALRRNGTRKASKAIYS